MDAENKSTSGHNSAVTWIAAGLGALVAVGLAAWFVFSPPSGPDASKAAPTATRTGSSEPRPRPEVNKAPTPVNASDLRRLIENAEPKELADLVQPATVIKDASVRRATLDALLARWLKVDPAGLSDFLFDSDGQTIDALIPSLAGGLPNVDDSLASSPILSELVQEFIAIYAEKDPSAALAWAKQWLVDEALDAAYASLAGGIAGHSADQALQVLSAIKDRANRIEAVANIASSFGEHDPEFALRWAVSLTDPAERKAAMENTVAALAEDQPERAAQLVQELNDPDGAAMIGGLVAAEWASRDPAEAIQWIQTLPDGTIKAQALEGALLEWSYDEPQRALEFFLKNYAQSPAYAEKIFEAWAYGNPEGAVREASKLTASQRIRAYSGIVRGWFDHDESTDTIATWIDSLPSGAERDSATRQLVSVVSLDEPKSGWTWAQSIDNPDIRRDALREAFVSLISSDVSAAQAALSHSRLSPRELAELEAVLAARQQMPGN